MNDCTLIENLRTPRIFGMAIFDLLFTYFGAYILAFFLFKTLRYFNLIKSKNRNFRALTFWTFVALVVYSTYLHDKLGISTMLGYYLELNDYPIVIKCFNISLAGMSPGGLDMYDHINPTESIETLEPDYTIEPIDPHHPLHYNPYWFMDY